MSGKKKILVLLIGFFVFFYACWAVGMSIYTENMPVVKAKSAVKTVLTFEGTIVAHYHRVEKQQEYVSVFDATVEEVLFEDGEDVGMGTPLFSVLPLLTGLIWPGICPPTTPFILNAAPRL